MSLLRASTILFFVAACGSSTETSTNEGATSPSPSPSDPILVAPKGPKTVFVTNAIFTGSLGGLLGADAKCQQEADAAGLGGRYRAWLGTSERTAVSRFAADTGPYVLVTGERVAPSFRSLLSGSIEHAIDRTATGGAAPPSVGETGCGGNLVWTSTRASGDYAGSDCNGWTSDVADGDEWPSLGIAGATSLQWTDWCYGPKCNFEAHLYCIEQ